MRRLQKGDPQRVPAVLAIVAYVACAFGLLAATAFQSRAAFISCAALMFVTLFAGLALLLTRQFPALEQRTAAAAAGATLGVGSFLVVFALMGVIP